MKKIKVFFIVLLTCSTLFTVLPAQSQNINTDSLQNALRKLKADSATIFATMLTGFKMPNKNIEAKFHIYNWGVEQSQKINCPAGVALGYRIIGLLHRDLLNSDEAVINLHKAIAVAEKNKLYKYQAQALDGLAGVYKSRKAYDKAIEYEKQAIAVQENNTKDILGLGSLYFNLGTFYYYTISNPSTADYEYVLTYFRKAVKIAEAAKDTISLVQIINGTSNIYTELGRYDTAELYLNKTEQLISKLKMQRLYNNFYLNKGRLFQSKKEYAKAIEAFNTGLLLIKKDNDKGLESSYYGRLSKSYAELGDTISAYKYFKLYDEALFVVNNEEKLRTTALIDGQFQKEKKDREIARLNNDQKIKQLELEKQEAVIAGNFLEAKRKEDQIKLLSQEKELQDLELVQQEQILAKNQLQATTDSQQIQLGKQAGVLQEKQISNQKRTRNYLIGGLALLGLLAFILYRNITAKKKAYTQLQYKSEQIKEQALQLSKQAKQIAQFQSQMNPHFVYNALHNIQGLVLIDEKNKANSQIQSLAQLMRKTFANADKDDIPLEEEINYLNKYIEFEKTAFGNNLNFEVTVTKDAEGTQIPPMMIQPFIENAIKHAELKKVQNPYIKVLIEIENNLLAINITDNGTGIKKDIAETDKLSHSLSVIKSRLDLLFKGRADVNNQPVFSVKTMPELAEGTSVKFYLPLNYAY